MNFGTLKDIFTEKLIESYTSDDKTGKELYKKFLKILKENETLKTTFIIYKNLETKTFKSEIAANDYLKESISILDKFRGEESINEQSKVLINLLEKNCINYKDRQTKDLHESIHNLLTIKKSVSTIDKIQESKENLVGWLMKEKEVISEETTYINTDVNPNKFLELAVNKFNEKYKDSLTEEEKNILKVLRENNEENTKTLVSNLVKETIELVNNHLELYGENVTVKSKLLETKDAIYKMAENNDSSNDKVLKLYDLKNNLKND
jgi:hypothetical protein